MKSKKALTLAILMLTVALILPYYVPTVSAPPSDPCAITSTGTYFEVVPDARQNIDQVVSQNITVPINITEAPATRAWGLKLYFNHLVLEVVDYSQGDFIAEGLGPGQGPMGVAYNNTEGWITAECALVGPGNVSGSDTLITIIFHVKEVGTSKLDLQDTFLLDPDLKRTDYPNNDGFFYTTGLTPLDDLTIKSVTANATNVQQGDPVGIDVEIGNTGTEVQHLNLSVFADQIVYKAGDPDVILVGDEILCGTNSCTTDINPLQTVVVHITWITTNVPGENYTISAEIFKPEDDDPNDNIFIDATVLVVCPDDVGIEDITIDETVVGQGQAVHIHVTVKNEGENKENLTVTVYADQTPPYLTTQIGSYTVEDLAASAVDVTAFTWDTTGVTPGVYVIGAKALITTSGVTEKDLADNELVDGGVAIIIMDVSITESNLVDPWVYRGGVAKLNFTIKNEGTVMARVPLVVLHYNPNDPATSGLGVITLVTIPPGVSYTFTSFSPYGGFPTAPFPEGQYYVCIFAYYLTWEVDTNDNGPYGITGWAPCLAGMLQIYWRRGDVNLDKETNVLDIILCCINLGPRPDPTKPPFVDVNFDGTCDVLDVILACINLGKWTPPP